MFAESKYEKAVEDREGEQVARAAADVLIRAEVEMAKALDRMTRGHAFIYSGASSVAHFGVLCGLARRKSKLLAAAGRVFRLMPVVERKVLEKEVVIESAAALAKVLDHPVLKEQAWEWLKQAAERTPEQLAFAIRKAIAEVDAETIVEPITLMFRPEVRDKMARIREIASRMTNHVLTNEEVVEFSFDYYLDREDEDRVPEGSRRKGPTVNDPSRAIPAAVKREVLRRGRQCQVHGCSHHLFLYYCHIEPHASGGSREADNLLLLCWIHHWALDHGLLRFSGTADEPVFDSSRGGRISPARAPPAA